jgi:hypothetical protein
MKQLSSSLAILLAAILFTFPVQAVLLQANGRITLLRVHNLGTRYGPPNDQIDVEVVVKLDTQSGKAFGFQLRNDINYPAHRSMLDLLRYAFKINRPVTIDYNIDPGKNNGVIIRVWLPPPPPLVSAEETPNLRITAEDPVVKNGQLELVTIEALPEFRHKGAHELMEETQWSFSPEIELGPVESHRFTVSFGEPTLLLANAKWRGSETPVKMVVAKEGVTLATGTPYPVPPDRGTVTAKAEIETAGEAIVSVTNDSNFPVKVRITVGTLPLSLREETP